jgi:hypothetical protein
VTRSFIRSGRGCSAEAPPRAGPCIAAGASVAQKSRVAPANESAPRDFLVCFLTSASAGPGPRIVHPADRERPFGRHRHPWLIAGENRHGFTAFVPAAPT